MSLKRNFYLLYRIPRSSEILKYFWTEEGNNPLFFPLFKYASNRLKIQTFLIRHSYLLLPEVVFQVICKKVFLRILQNLQENTCARVSFLGLRYATLLKRRLWCRRFPVKFAKFLRTPFFIEKSD